MMTAKESRERMTLAINGTASHEIERIDYEINKAASSGKDHAELYGEINKVMALYLQNLGYEVHISGKESEPYFTIRW